MVKRLLLFLALSTLLFAAPTSPSKAGAPHPLEAELVSALHSGKVQPGDRVLAKLVYEWKGNNCTLPRGSALVGHVAERKPWNTQGRVTSVRLVFEAPCAQTAAVPLTWIALMAPDDSDLAGLHDGNPVERQAFRSTSFGEGGGIGAPTNTQSNHTDLSGRQDPSLPVSIAPAPDRAHPRPSSIGVGQVWRIRDLSLSVATGSPGGSVLSSPKKELHVARGAVLVLLPTAEFASGSGAAANGASPPGIERALQVSASKPAKTAASLRGPMPESSEGCQPATCSVVRHALLSSAPTSVPLQRLSLAGLPYHRLSSAEMTDFEYGAALAFLGPEHLLFTFNPRTLVPRHAEDDPHSRAHMVRAVLFDLRTGAVENTADWRVSDDRQYLWIMDGDRVLVHADGSLRVLDAHLRQLASLLLTSPLAFVRTSPDNTHIAVGQVHELHSTDVHTSLAEENSSGPEEEVVVSLVNAGLQSLSTTRQSSYALPPVLSDRGNISLIHEGGTRWHYEETSWSGEKRIVARIQSTCLPNMASLSNALLFANGCDVSVTRRWYRVLRMDGTAVLKGSLSSQDTQPFPAADSSGDAFAVALPVVRTGYSPGSTFHGADLSSEEVSAYRFADGHPLFSVPFHAPSPTRQPIAFAPRGHRLAVLDGDHILIYAVPVTERSPRVAASHAQSALSSQP